MKNLWQETIDPITGKSSLQTHEVKTLKVGCKENEHNFVFSGGSLREAVCSKCQLISSFILGYHDIKDGKIVVRKHVK
jgi:hypothetical protein